MLLAEMTWPDVQSLSRDTVVLIPTAAIEQHGPHLPLATDTLLVEAVAQAVGEPYLVTPTLWLGASTHHLAFAGTLSASMPSYFAAIDAVIESLTLHQFRRFALLNGHGGNSTPNDVILRQWKDRDPKLELANINYWAGSDEVIAKTLGGPDKSFRHACEAETSLMLHLHPHLVRMDLAAPGGLHRSPEVTGRIDHFDEISERGSLGYPNLATPEKGEIIFDACVMWVSSQLSAFAQPTVLHGNA
jgi:creatinine amidohydrolase